MIGVSLPTDWLSDGTGPSEERAALLRELRQAGVDSVELRTVGPETPPQAVAAAAALLKKEGFGVTVHGAVRSVETAVRDVFDPLQELLADRDGAPLTVTVHPIDGDNAAMLRALAEKIERDALPVRIALENERRLPDRQEGDSVALVTQAVCAVDSPHIGICFDMGHYLYWCLKNRPEQVHEDTLPLPDAAFLQRVIHTHIHALNGTETHYPLKGYRLPLAALLAGMAFNYFGVYDIELSFDRFAAVCPPRQALTESVAALYAALPHCARLYRRTRLHFTDWMRSASRVLTPDGVWTDAELGGDAAFGFVHASVYLFRTGGVRWAMDPALRYASFLSDGPDHIKECFAGVKYVLLTHDHVDHTEKETVQQLAEMGVQFVLPPFVASYLREWGVPAQQMTVVEAGKAVTLDGLTVLPFEGQHYRPGTRLGVPEYGYIVSTPGGPTLAFPGDVRDFSTEDLPPLPRADVVFAHMWMGDGDCLRTDYAPYDDALAAFALHFSDKAVFLTHLYENGRMDKDLWRVQHAEIAAAALRRQNPGTQAIIPCCGQVFRIGRGGVQAE